MRFDVKKINPKWDKMRVRELNDREEMVRGKIRSIEADRDMTYAERDALTRPLWREVHDIIETRSKMDKVMCSVCGKTGYYSGSMFASLDLQTVWCKEHVPGDVVCVEIENKIGVNETPVPDGGSRGKVSWRYGEVVLWAEPVYYGVNGQTVLCGYYSYVCWVQGGSVRWMLTDGEVARLARGEYREVLREIANMRKDGMWRCTGCGKEMKNEDVAGWPLFAGCNCKECWEKHCEETEEQRKTGKVCSICGKPWNSCYC